MSYILTIYILTGTAWNIAKIEFVETKKECLSKAKAINESNFLGASCTENYVKWEKTQTN